jgi:hypothetical protein
MARRKSGSIPGIRLHRPSGRAVVTLSGQDFYCGTFGTKVALVEYDRHVAEWLARKRRPLMNEIEDGRITVVELALAYHQFAKGYFNFEGLIAARLMVDMLGGIYSFGEQFGTLVRVDWQASDKDRLLDDLVRTLAVCKQRLGIRLNPEVEEIVRA